MKEQNLRITLLTHTHPDGDAVGSTTGLYHYLQHLGHRPTLVLPDACPENLQHLLPERLCIHNQDPEQGDALLENCDLLVCLDFNQLKRSGSAEAAATRSQAKKILVDHHINPERTAFEEVYSEPVRSSTCELVYYLLLQQPDVNGKAQNLPFQTLYSLTTGLLTDTNNFNNSTTPATFRMAADVCEQGIDLDEITGRLYRSSRPNRLDLMGYLLNERRLRFPELGAEIMTFSLADQKKFDYLSGESEGFVNLPLQTKQVHLSGLFTETTEGYVRVSLRSKRGFSANRLAQQYFNGGGHENAAGGRLYLPIQEVPAYFENAVRAFMEQSENRAQVL